MKTIINNKKHEDFRKLISDNRALLLSNGYPESTISRWAAGQRIPRQDSAQRLAYLLNVPLALIPHRVDIIT